MRSFTPKMIGVMAEALSVYGRVIRRNLLSQIIAVAAFVAVLPSMSVFVWLLAGALLTGGCGPRDASIPVGPTVLEVLPMVDRNGDIFGTGSRHPLALRREIENGRAVWTASYTEQVGQEKKHVLRTIRISPDGQETVLSSKPLDGLVFAQTHPGTLVSYLRFSGRDSAAVSRVDFNPKGAKGVFWFGEERVEVSDGLMWKLSLAGFAQLIATADRIVIRDGGHDCCGAKVDEQPILAEVTDPAEIAAFNALFEFAVPKDPYWCACCGHPGIDWWKDGVRIALTSAHHGTDLRWRDFPGDAPFSSASAQALADWFKARGLSRQWRRD